MKIYRWKISQNERAEFQVTKLSSNSTSIWKLDQSTFLKSWCDRQKLKKWPPKRLWSNPKNIRVWWSITPVIMWHTIVGLPVERIYRQNWYNHMNLHKSRGTWDRDWTVRNTSCIDTDLNVGGVIGEEKRRMASRSRKQWQITGSKEQRPPFYNHKKCSTPAIQMKDKFFLQAFRQKLGRQYSWESIYQSSPMLNRYFFF